MGHSPIDGRARHTRRRCGNSVFASPARKWNAGLIPPIRLDTYLEFIRFVRSDLKAEQIHRLLSGVDGRPRREALHGFVST